MRTIVLYLFFVSLNFETLDLLNASGYFTVSKLLGFIYIFTIIPQWTHFFAIKKIVHFLVPLWLFFGLLSVMNVIYSHYDVNGRISFLDYFSILQNLFLFWILINQERKKPMILEKCMLCFAFGAALEAGLFQAGIGVEEVGGRMDCLGDGPNGMGLKMTIGMSIFVMAVLQDRLKLGKWRYLLLVPLPFMMQLVVMSASRVALVAFGLALVTVVVVFKTKRVLVKIGLLGLGAIAAFAVWQSVVADEAFSTRLLSSVYDYDLSGRDAIWEDLLPLVVKRPFFGSGETGYLQFADEAFGGFTSPHNVLLEVVCYTGIVGLGLYLWFLWWIFQSGWQSYKAEGLLLPLVLCVPVMGCILSGQVLTWKLVWCILAYIVGNSLWKPNLAGRRRAILRPKVTPVLASRPRTLQPELGKVVVGEGPIQVGDLPN
jgi:O-antigen ligase